MITLSNKILTVKIAEKGAEIQSISNQETGLEYMWDGDPKFWGKHSPVLFPIVGGLKNNQYTYQGHTYEMGRHGFARDTVFAVIEQSEESVIFGIVDNKDTFQKYPFHFQFSVMYELIDNELSITYHVKNTGKEQLYFSVGAHPAFKIPLVSGTTYTDYYLEFGQKENAPIYPLDENGQIKSTSIPFLENAGALPLKKELFYKDALVFKELHSETISIKSSVTNHGLTVSFAGFPYLGIWSAKDADFVCIEPWNGIADSENTTGELENKEGIIALKPAQNFVATWSIQTF